MKLEYKERINLVLAYIDENLSSSLELNTLAQIGCFSPYHFHRLFKAFVGESLGFYIKRRRLEYSVHFLIYSELSVTEIGFKVGYETPSSYSSAFQKYFKCAPSQYRKEPDKYKKQRKFIMKTFDESKIKERVEVVPAMNVAFVRAKGYNPETISKAWNTLIPEGLKGGFFNPGKTRCIGISLDNPDVISEDDCEYHASLVLENPIEPKGEISVKKMSGGKYAVFTYKGPYEDLPALYDYVFKCWLDKNDKILREEAEVFEEYLNSITNTKPEDLLTEVFLPIY